MKELPKESVGMPYDVSEALVNYPWAAIQPHSDALLGAVLKSSHNGVWKNVMKVLSEGGWRQEAAAKRIAEALRVTKDSSIQYSQICLLQRIAADGAGPKTLEEFREKKEEWVRKWLTWADARK